MSHLHEFSAPPPNVGSPLAGRVPPNTPSSPVSKNFPNGAIQSVDSVVPDGFSEHTTKMLFHVTESLVSADKKCIKKMVAPIVTKSALPAGYDKVLITGITVSNKHNEFPYALQVEIGSHKNAATGVNSTSGASYSVTMWADSDTHNTEVILDDITPLATNVVRRFAGHTLETLRDGIVDFGNGVSYIPDGHIVKVTYEMNATRFGSALVPVDDGFYKVSTAAVNDIISEISSIMSKTITITDLSTFSVAFSRLNGKPLNDLSESKWNHFDDIDKQSLMKKELTAGFELTLRYVIPKSKVASGHASNYNAPVPVNTSSPSGRVYAAPK